MVYPVGSNAHARTLYGHAADEYAKPRAVWDASGDYVLSNSHQEGTVYCWCLASQRVVGRLEGHKGNVRDLSAAADSRLMATASYDRSVRVWRGAN